MTASKPSARFLPTLTEVVQLVPAQPDPVAQIPLDGAGEAVVQRAMALLEAQWEQRIQSDLQLQARYVLEALRDEMKAAVESAVQQALRDK
jgi:hypothetical protein